MVQEERVSCIVKREVHATTELMKAGMYETELVEVKSTQVCLQTTTILQTGNISKLTGQRLNPTECLLCHIFNAY